MGKQLKESENTIYSGKVIKRMFSDREFQKFHEDYKAQCSKHAGMHVPTEEQYSLAKRARAAGIDGILKIAKEDGIPVYKVHNIVRKVARYEWFKS